MGHSWGYHSWFIEFADPSSVVFFYPVGYTNADQCFFLWKPGIDPNQEFERFMKRALPYSSRADLPAARVGSQYCQKWEMECWKLLRIPRGEEAEELVELLYAIQSAPSVKKGQLPSHVVKELHGLVWSSISSYDQTAMESYGRARTALKAVAEKVAAMDSRIDIYDGLDAIKRFLEN